LRLATALFRPSSVVTEPRDEAAVVVGSHTAHLQKTVMRRWLTQVLVGSMVAWCHEGAWQHRAWQHRAWQGSQIRPRSTRRYKQGVIRTGNRRWR